MEDGTGGSDNPIKEIIRERVKVEIPDSEIPESLNKNGLLKPVILDNESGLRFKGIKGKKIFIEKGQ